MTRRHLIVLCMLYLCAGMTLCTLGSKPSLFSSNGKQRTAFSLPSGKLDLYVAAAGFQASQTLPCVLDMGTNNMDLRKDPTYMGLNQDRINGDKFYEVQSLTHSLTHSSVCACTQRTMPKLAILLVLMHVLSIWTQDSCWMLT